MLKLDVFNARYDDAIPAFIDCGPMFWFHRPSGRLITKDSLTKWLASFTPAKTLAPGESGDVPSAYEHLYVGFPVPAAAAAPTSTGGATGGGPTQTPPPAYQAPSVTQPTGLPITGDASGTQTTLIDLDFHSQDIPTGGKTATVTYNVGATDQNLPVPLTAGQTPTQAGGAITAAIDGVAELGATKTGTQITVTPTDGTTLSKLTLAIA